ncbi:hypothetical protein C8E03_102225 [Lachnotalea glycerini]|uniref:Uncharacterized protein n=1 Tax=Lachnotalea glycerini TaxID=1763509 RepID=A0A318EPU7_9FIRM|nr:permease prefix domain 1-containing protein [Lachnotalea glycerini]OYP37289.1 hypothetical protein CG709_05820 [Lachnotalea glycerini]PXV93457.1 hypothetical protein C8E03_102225 [Lachnotalea glycerini]
MNKENYLKIVINQIRCEKAKGMISEEIENHIDDQAKVYIDMGMGEAEAMAKAVKEMGDPVDTGVSLDRIHRPKMAWKYLSLSKYYSNKSTKKKKNQSNIYRRLKSWKQFEIFIDESINKQ